MSDTETTPERTVKITLGESDSITVGVALMDVIRTEAIRQAEEAFQAFAEEWQNSDAQTVDMFDLEIISGHLRDLNDAIGVLWNLAPYPADEPDESA